MNRTTAFAALAPAALLAACASTTPPAPAPAEPAPPEGPAMACNAQPGQTFIGRKASGETGAAIVAATGARTLRWGPPGAVFTMDFRQDRVNVMYDQSMAITEVRCG